MTPVPDSGWVVMTLSRQDRDILRALASDLATDSPRAARALVRWSRRDRVRSSFGIACISIAAALMFVPGVVAAWAAAGTAVAGSAALHPLARD